MIVYEIKKDSEGNVKRTFRYHESITSIPRISILASSLRKLREKKGLSLEEVAKSLGFSDLPKTIDTIYAIEQEFVLASEYIDRLLTFYEVSEEEIAEILKQNNRAYEIFKETYTKKPKESNNGIGPYFSLLIDNLELLYKHIDFILSDPKYARISIGSSRFMQPGGGITQRNLFLAELLPLWQNSSWVRYCPKCGEKHLHVYFVQKMGFFTYTCHIIGFCTNCNSIQSAYPNKALPRFAGPIYDVQLESYVKDENGEIIKKMSKYNVPLGVKLPASPLKLEDILAILKEKEAEANNK
ncbi:MAG: hypothetical protein B6226_05530 [Candidatus Cloacimonetes bacterium 4572_65]|nr:MAG: hypothetical protein B6226_05530 [Candidatus Cloacimonetes bacterium 4572_65]